MAVAAADDAHWQCMQMARIHKRVLLLRKLQLKLQHRAMMELLHIGYERKEIWVLHDSVERNAIDAVTVAAGEDAVVVWVPKGVVDKQSIVDFRAFLEDLRCASAPYCNSHMH